MGLRSNTVATPVTPLPTIEAIIEGQGAQAPEAPQVAAEPPKEESSQLDRIEREQKHRRELFAAQKRIKDLESKLGDTSNKTSILESKNPIKALAKEKGFSQDDVVKMALEAMDDDLSDEEKKDDLSRMKPEEIAKMVREQIEAENKQKENLSAQEQAVKDFKGKIAEKAKEVAEKMPLVDALGGSEAAFNFINEQFIKDSEEYGEDYARENMLSIEDAIKKTNEVLAQNVKKALQSKYLRDFILKAIKEDGLQDGNSDQSEDDEQLEDEAVTLTNTGHRAATEATGKPKFRSNEEELDYLINKLI